ncbi:MAG: hypothetical protein H6Q86_3616 [candidate division NC10 bacterium]|nr:hypothetical protein [candidate division NC10 bacterium]
MRRAICDRCQQTHAVKDMFLVFGRPLCEPCADAELGERGDENIPDGAVQRQVDPTICSGCERDNGDRPFPLLGGGVPACPECERTFRNPSFPGWVKAGFAGLIVLMVLSSLGNWRFLKGYLDFRNGVRRVAAQDLNSAVALLDSASESVPESVELAGWAALAHGWLLLSQDQPAEALPFLRTAELKARSGPAVAELILSAEGGAAFVRKDYDQFLSKARALQEKHPDQPMFVAGVASALACKWAVNGDVTYRQQALEHLDRARQLGGSGDALFREYEGRILYRLDSREIIQTDEYRRRFPNGYVRKGESR